MLKKFLKNCKPLTIDDDVVSIGFNPPISASMLDAFERKKKNKLPKELRELYSLTNGLNFFDVEILPLHAIEFSKEDELWSFHSWGNGDFDYVSSDSSKQKGKIYFSDHSIENIAIVSSSLTRWFKEVYKEIKTRGILLHPMDFEKKSKQTGLYKNVFITLNKRQKNVSKPAKTSGPSKIKVPIKVPAGSVERLISAPFFKKTQSQISKTLDIPIDKDSTKSSIKYVKEEIAKSGMSMEMISNYIRQNPNTIVQFSKYMFDDGKGSFLEVTNSINFAIFLIYLYEHENELVNYIERLEIPNAKKFAARLWTIKEKLAKSTHGNIKRS